MTSDRRSLLLNALKILDLWLMTSVLTVAALVNLQHVNSISLLAFFSMRIKIQNIAIVVVLILVWHVAVRLAGLYNSRRLASFKTEIADVIISTSLAAATVSVLAVCFRIRLVTPLFIVIFWAGTTCALASSRIVLRLFLQFVRRRGRNLRELVIVGINRRSLAFAARIRSHSELGYRILSFVDKEWEGREDASRAGYPILSDIVGFQHYLRTNVVDEVIMALPFRSMHDEALRIAAICEEQGVTVRVLPNLFGLKRACPSAEELAEVPVLTLSTGSKEGWPIVAKRIVDITISTISLILLCPLMLAVVALIKITSPGPALFAQKRVGLNKRPFRLLKFRTMVADAEERLKEVEHLNEVTGPVFKIRHDPRLTPVGRILRRTSIDELPQLVNVLLGDMSLVGPRPLPDRDYKGFREDWQRRRFSVQPGITCLWQIYGRSSIPFDKWMELDLQYIDKWSLRLDAEILLRTIPAVLRGSGAA